MKSARRTSMSWHHHMISKLYEQCFSPKHECRRGEHVHPTAVVWKYALCIVHYILQASTHAPFANRISVRGICLSSTFTMHASRQGNRSDDRLRDMNSRQGFDPGVLVLLDGNGRLCIIVLHKQIRMHFLDVAI
jgi:hypothetical protein